MKYESTRDSQNVVTASQAILQGLAPDGGLYVPTELERIDFDWEALAQMTYQDLAYAILKVFLSDFSDEDLKECINSAYDDKFDDPLIAPLVKVDDHFNLELFHGQTIAFKDMALSILPYLMKTAARMNDDHNEIVILTATSGDTGKAAMAGFSGVPGTRVIVFYPDGGVSSIQERMMLTQKDSNTWALAVEGNFDDTQTRVKKIFNDPEMNNRLADQGMAFSSANSMNIGRLVPQVVYYFYAYVQLLRTGSIQPGDKVNFVVPTGNFGNILAAYYAKQIGLPVDRLVCASNENTVLYDFFRTGTYDRRRDFKLTISPSMDILISSNFERLLYHALGNDTQTLRQLMDDLKNKGWYTVPERSRQGFKDFIGQFATEDETRDEIRAVYNQTGYIMDTHTAVASRCYRKTQHQLEGQTVVVSTASPFKFPQAVLSALGEDQEGWDDQQRLERLKDLSGKPFPPAIDEVLHNPIKPRKTIQVDQMEDAVLDLVMK